MEPYLGFLLALAIGWGLNVLNVRIANRAGLSPATTMLVGTLKDNVSALSERVAQLEKTLTDERAKGSVRETKIADLQAAVTDLAMENAALRRQLGMPPR